MPAEKISAEKLAFRSGPKTTRPLKDLSGDMCTPARRLFVQTSAGTRGHQRSLSLWLSL